MGFLNDMLVAFGQAAAAQNNEQVQIVAGRRRRAAGGGNDGLKKVAECTPCELNAYIDSLRPQSSQPKKKRRKR